MLKKTYTIEKAKSLIEKKKAKLVKKYPQNLDQIEKVIKDLEKNLYSQENGCIYFSKSFFNKFILGCFEFAVLKEIENGK